MQLPREFGHCYNPSHNFAAEIILPAPLDVLKDIFVPKPGEAPGLFQAAASIVTLSAIYLYFTGYVYCYFYYFGFFQIPLETLDATP